MSALGKGERNKLLRAAALAYRPGMTAPVLTAYGEGNVAQRIIDFARQYNIELSEGEATGLLAALRSVRINDSVPPELYSALAVVFAHLYDYKNRLKRDKK